MVILKLLERSRIVKDYKILEYKTFSDGFYIKIIANIKDHSQLFIKEYSDLKERNYSYHWQKKNGVIIIRWDNSPYHKNVPTYPHHKHIKKKILPSNEVTLKDILDFIQKILK